MAAEYRHSRRLFCARSIGSLSRIGFIGLFTTITPFLWACTPTLNWRTVRHPDGLWQATFPGKPVMVVRTIPLSHQGRVQPIELTLWATKVQEHRFTLGVARISGEGPDHPKAQNTSALSTQEIAESLESAMVRNIQGQRLAPSGLSGYSSLQGVPTNLSIIRRPRISATGQIQLDLKKDPVAAILSMQTWVTPTQVIEALVIGPEEGFLSEASDQFIASVEIRVAG